MTDHDPIDALVAELRADVPEMSDRAFRAGRAHLQSLVGPVPPPASIPEPEPVRASKRRFLRSPPRLVASAAAVVVLAAGVLVVQTVRFDDNAPVANAAATQLNSAADRIRAADPPLRPGQVRYLATHSWGLATHAVLGPGGTTEDMGISYLQEGLSEKWVPAGPVSECRLRVSVTGRYKWVVGDDAKAEELGVGMPRPDSSDHLIPCGDFADGAWQRPSTDFLAALPRDPDALYDRLRADTEGRGQDPDLEVLVYVADVLRTGLVPADLRAALYRALAKVPGLEITERVANLDGRKGTAFGLSREGTRHDVIVDPATGQFVGERQVDEEGRDVPPGTVTSYSSVSTAVVGAVGDKPGG